MRLARIRHALVLLACACDPPLAVQPPDPPPVPKASSAQTRPGPAVSLASGNFHTCAGLRDGDVRCWGMGKAGQLGDGAAVQRDVPVRAGEFGDVVGLSAEGDRTCAVRRGGDVWCWGRAAGAEDTNQQVAPTHSPEWHDVRQLVLGLDHDCAITGSGGVVCRGSNTRGALGDGTEDPHDRPVAALGIQRAGEVGVGYGFSCALEDGKILCWGWTADGRCGDDSPTDHLVPTTIAGLPPARGLSVGFDHACAVLADRSVRCWGGNLFGQLGDGTTETRRRPTPIVGLSDVMTVRAGAHQTTATRTDGAAFGWGRAGGDQPILWPACSDPQVRQPSGRRNGVWVAGPDELYCPRPTAIAGLTDTTQVVSSSLHACALLRSGQVWCWGSDAYGSLGDRGTGDMASPVLVALD